MSKSTPIPREENKERGDNNTIPFQSQTVAGCCISSVIETLVSLCRLCVFFRLFSDGLVSILWRDLLLRLLWGYGRLVPPSSLASRRRRNRPSFLIRSKMQHSEPLKLHGSSSNKQVPWLAAEWTLIRVWVMKLSRSLKLAPNSCKFLSRDVAIDRKSVV